MKHQSCVGPLAIALLAVSFGMPVDAQAQDRMPPIPAEQMTAAQQQALQEFAGVRGQLTGPWIAFMRSPGMINRARGLSDYLRFNSSLPPRLSEFAILITARQWTQQYEWVVHHPLAMKGGLHPEIAKAVAEGRRPDAMAADEAALYDFCMELHRTQRVSDATYARAKAAFGEHGIVDLVGLSGWYTLVAMMLNTAQSPLPPGVEPPLTPLPR